MPPNPLTPIPIGSPHLADPPTFNRFDLGYFKSYRIDKRDYERRALLRDVWLIDSHSQTVMRCRTNDISDAGLHANAPIGFGLAVGQRYELRVASADAHRGMTSHRARSFGYGTVIRTEMHADGRESDRVGFAMRFDVPQLIDV